MNERDNLTVAEGHNLSKNLMKNFHNTFGVEIEWTLFNN